MAHDVVSVPTECKGAQLFCEMVGHIQLGVDSFQDNEVPLNPFTKHIVFDIHMSDTGGWFAGIGHSPAGVVILICHRCGSLGNSQVPEDAATVENHFAAVGRLNIFCLSR